MVVICRHNSSTGSDSAASGAGPDTAITGTGAAHTGNVSTTTITLTNTPDLSGVAAEDLIYLAGNGLYEITAVDDGADTVTIATAITIDNASPVDYAIGGWRLSLDQWFTSLQSGWHAELNDGGTFSTSTGYTVTGAGTGAGTACKIYTESGYSTRATISKSTTSGELLYFDTGTAGNFIFEDVAVDATAASSIAVRLETEDLGFRAINCDFHAAGNCFYIIRGGAFYLSDCTITSNSGIGIRTWLNAGSIRLLAERCTISSGDEGIDMSTFSSYGFVHLDRCVFSDCGGTTASGILYGSAQKAMLIVKNCSFYDIGLHGIELTGTPAVNGSVHVENNIFQDCGQGGTGYSVASSVSLPADSYFYMDTNAHYSNGSGEVNNVTQRNGITLTGSPFTDAAGGDFSLNNTAGAGAACRGVALA